MEMAAASLATSEPEPEPEFQVSVKTALHDLKGQMEKMRGELKSAVKDLVKSSDFNSAEIIDVKSKLELQNTEITGMRCELSEALRTINAQAARIEELVGDQNVLETYMRRSNLIFEGCAETENENTTSIVEEIIINVMNLNVNIAVEVDKTHRFGRSIAGRPRPIIVRFVRHSIRDKVLSSANKLKHHKERIFINEDLPALIRSRRAELRFIVKHARDQGTTATQSGDKVKIAGVHYDYKTLQCLPAKYTLESATTKAIGPNTIGFHSKNSPLSNFYSCSFVLEGVKYTSVEQAYQAAKAVSVGRNDVSKNIMAQTDCIAIMKLGNMLKPPRGSPWFEQRDTIMEKAVRAKFSQNDALWKKLDATADSLLIETTRDPYWGAGVPMNSPALLNNTWNGQNKLGKTLIEVRRQLRI